MEPSESLELLCQQGHHSTQVTPTSHTGEASEGSHRLPLRPMMSAMSPEVSLLAGSGVDPPRSSLTPLPLTLFEPEPLLWLWPSSVWYPCLLPSPHPTPKS